jgi:carboxynorspermidine decarboxylase
LLPTHSSGAGSFRDFDLNRVKSPCFVVDEHALQNNLKILNTISFQSGAKILLAVKAFSMWSLAPLFRDYLDGVCASGIWEAILGKKRMGFDKICTYSPAYKEAEFKELAELSSHIVFNSPQQYLRFAQTCKTQNASVGLRINPLHSEGIEEKYDPCSPTSRLGFPIDQLQPAMLEGIEGIHMHTLCEQDFPPLERTWRKLWPYLERWGKAFKWINLGGGHMLTSPSYQKNELIAFLQKISKETGAQIYLEPGESVALDTGILVGEVLDVMDRNLPSAILDISATCHMPDVLEAPYRPAMLNEADEGVKIQLGGPSCLTGDNIGTYTFETLPKPGQRIAFLDQAHYTMVKTNTFNGIPLPSIAVWNSQTDDLKVIREFEYTDFETRLS